MERVAAILPMLHARAARLNAELCPRLESSDRFIPQGALTQQDATRILHHHMRRIMHWFMDLVDAPPLATFTVENQRIIFAKNPHAKGTHTGTLPDAVLQQLQTITFPHWFTGFLPLHMTYSIPEIGFHEMIMTKFA